MNIAIGSDHAGFCLKEFLATHLKNHQHVVKNVGCLNEEPVDYPDYALAVAKEITSKNCQKGIVICGSGVGASIAANKVKGIRAAVCHDTYSAHQGVEHDDMNVLVLGARIIGQNLAQEIVDAFIEARFSNEERHVRRLKKVLAIEQA